MKSWKTSLAGVGAILAAVGHALAALFDNDPATVVQLDVTIGAILAGVGLIAARDNGVSSEQAGVKPEVK